MATRNVSFYGNSPLIGQNSAIQRDYAADPRRQMAEQLMAQGSSTAPVRSPLEGMTRALQAGVGGYFGGQADRETKEREDKQIMQMSEALAAATPQIMPTYKDVTPGSEQAEMLAAQDAGMYSADDPYNPGGMPAVISSLEATGNPDQNPAIVQLQMGEIARQQALVDAAAAQQAARENYKFEQQNKVFAPKVPVPGRDAPYPKDVEKQRSRISAAGKPKWVTSVDPKTGLSVQTNSATGEQKSSPGQKPMTGDQSNAALFADRMRASDKILSNPEMEAAAIDLQQVVLSKTPGVANYLISKEYRQYDQAKRDFINATLRRESGAAIAPHEFDNANKQYFPQPNDDPKTIKQKKENRLTALKGISRAAGPTYKPQEDKLPDGVSEEDALATMKANNLTRDQFIKQYKESKN